MHASTQLLRLEGGKPALDEISVRRREVRIVPGEPSADPCASRTIRRARPDLDVEVDGAIRHVSSLPECPVPYRRRAITRAH